MNKEFNGGSQLFKFVDSAYGYKQYPTNICDYGRKIAFSVLKTVGIYGGYVYLAFCCITFLFMTGYAHYAGFTSGNAIGGWFMMFSFLVGGLICLVGGIGCAGVAVVGLLAMVGLGLEKPFYKAKDAVVGAFNKVTDDSVFVTWVKAKHDKVCVNIKRVD